MKNQRNTGSSHHLHKMKLELSKTNEKLDILIELLAKILNEKR